MSFMYAKYLPAVIIILVIFFYFYFKAGLRFRTALETYWALRPKLRYHLSHVFYLAFVSLLLVAAMDLRGPEESIEGSVSDQKTLIVIDSSSSMLAEDVRPNRFEKAIMLAKHFVKSAYGHQVGIVVFSDIQKMLIPFTDDVDLLDARLGGLVEQKELTGGSNIYQTIRESIRYFVADGGEDPVGNILLFSDAEAHDETFKLEVPDGINVAIVGVGTARGARIPIRDKNGTFRGYKKYNGEEVKSSLNEDLLKDIGKYIGHYRYWIVQAYNLPTDEILAFFNRSYLDKLSKSTQRVRPVLGHYLIILAIIFYVIGVFLTRGKTFKPLAIFICFFSILQNPARAQDDLMKKLQAGSISKDEKLKLAKDLVDTEKYDESIVLYDEASHKEKLPARAALNYGTSMLAAGNVAGGLAAIAQAESSAPNELSNQEKSIIRSNVLNAIKQQQEQQKQDQQKKQQQDKKQDKDGKNKQNQQQDNQKGEQKDQQDQKKEGQGNDKKDDEKKNSKSNAQKLKERQEQQRKERAMKKVPALVKQVLEDDRKLQEQYLDTTTSKPEDTTRPKDW